jgi:PLP dependent protein
MVSLLLDNLSKIRSRIEVSARRAGRDPRAVHLVAVTKYAAPSQVEELLTSGAVSEIGENRVQDAAKRKAALGAAAAKVRWRMIGHLQSNKARQALEVFDAIDTIDSEKTAKRLDEALEGSDRVLPVLLQVNIGGKETQSGIEPESVGVLLEALAPLKRVKVEGLMTIAPNVEPVEATRPYFKRMRELFERFFAGRPDARLSMGMSRDYEIAVEEGSNQIRIGSSIFSECTHQGRVLNDR